MIHAPKREERLAAVPLFCDLDDAELEQVSHLMTDIRAGAGAVLMRQGESGSEFVIVLDGQVEVTHDGRSVATLGPGTWFGEIALLDSRPRTATVAAKTTVTIEVLTRNEFCTLLADVPDLSVKLLATMARRLAELKGDDVLRGSGRV